MEKNLFVFKKWRTSIFLSGGFLLVLLLAVSCAQGFDGHETFASSVTNAQLESPGADKITVSSVVNTKGEEEFKIEWPVIYGAGGYQFSLYIVDDPDNPIVVGEEDEILDKCYTQRAKQEDTKYKIMIKTLGNEKYNNTTASRATELDYSTLVPKVAEIPNGTDLAEYFATNPIQSDGTEQAYELVTGGNYTINGTLDFGLNWITLRGDKIDHAKITYGNAGRMTTMGGLRLKFIDFDCSEVQSSDSNAALLLFNSVPDASILGTGNYYIINNEVAIQSCNITGINRYLVYDNNKQYCAEKLRIQDCIIALNSTTEIIYMQGGFVNELSLIQNTFYGLIESGSYFLRYNNSGRPDRAGFVRGAIALYNNTFYNIVKNGQMGNYSGMNNAMNDLKMTKNLFVNCGNRDVVRRISGGGTNMVRTLVDNCYWFEGGFTSGQEMGHSQGDNTTANKSVATGFYEETSFTGPINDANTHNVNFTPTGTEILRRGVGDPRWLSAQ